MQQQVRTISSNIARRLAAPKKHRAHLQPPKRINVHEQHRPVLACPHTAAPQPITSSIRNALIAYGALVNVGSYGLFFYDKQQAVHHGWRVPEKTLQLSALAGGFIGGMVITGAT